MTIYSLDILLSLFKTSLLFHVRFHVLTVASWSAYGFLRGQVRWSGIPISFRDVGYLPTHPNNKVIFPSPVPNRKQLLPGLWDNSLPTLPTSSLLPTEHVTGGPSILDRAAIESWKQSDPSQEEAVLSLRPTGTILLQGWKSTAHPHLLLPCLWLGTGSVPLWQGQQLSVVHGLMLSRTPLPLGRGHVTGAGPIGLVQRSCVKKFKSSGSPPSLSPRTQQAWRPSAERVKPKDGGSLIPEMWLSLPESPC